MYEFILCVHNVHKLDCVHLNLIEMGASGGHQVVQFQCVWGFGMLNRGGVYVPICAS